MKLAVLGDSLTYGFPFGPGVSWLSVLGEKLSIDTINCGVCGETSSDMLVRAISVLRLENLTHLIIFGGANDIILDNRPVEFIVKDILAIQKASLSCGAKTGCILPLVPMAKMYSEDFLALREALAVRSIEKVKLIDMQPALLPEDNGVNYFQDEVHLSVSGNRVLGGYAARELADWLQEGR